MASFDEVRRALVAAYGPQPEEVLARCYMGLRRVAVSIEAGELAQAGIEAVMLRLPEILPAGMAKLEEIAELLKAGAAWQDQPRLPAGAVGGGQWTSDGSAGSECATPMEGQARSPATRVDPLIAEKAGFVSKHFNDAAKAAAELGVPVENILGISALESGWGKSSFAVHNNYFGIHHPAYLEVNSFPTKTAGVRGATFASYADSLKSFLHSSGYLVRGKSDPATFAAALQDSGKFGIDPDTGGKVPGYVAHSAATMRGLRPFLPK
jgi:hypothetical protein